MLPKIECFKRYLLDMYVVSEVVSRVCCHAPKNSPLAVDYRTVLAPSMQRSSQFKHRTRYIIKIDLYRMTAQQKHDLEGGGEGGGEAGETTLVLCILENDTDIAFNVPTCVEYIVSSSVRLVTLVDSTSSQTWKHTRKIRNTFAQTKPIVVYNVSYVN